ncbi:hypothetical protein FRC08_008819 [Ceratobasidium sp. 394]|nr:hypothetical protein FRC08_008819 [Ceratobasidium sp. 394]KAG9082715.1 hypothetical protein FS749_006633 [Ceratobasidium sp. UAMH 11750]
MTTSVPPYSRVASVSSILFRAACYICLRIIPGRVAPPGILLFYIIYVLSYWLGGRKVPALDKAKLEAANGHEANGHPVQAIRKHRDIDNAPGTTFLLTLPTSSRTLRRMSFFANAVLFYMAMDFVTKPHFVPANDLTFTRVGAVDSTSAKIVARYPAAFESATTTSTPTPTPSIIEVVQEAVDGVLPEVTLPPKVEEILTPAPTPRITSLRVQWRKTGFDSGSLDSLWTDGPIIEMSESRDWVGMAKLTGLQASAEYEYRLIELDGKVWPPQSTPLSFRTTPDSRLARGSHFRFVSTSCVVPNFPYNPFISGTRVKGFDLLADHIWPAQPEVKDTPTKAEAEPAPAPPVAEESPEFVAAPAASTDTANPPSSSTTSEHVSATPPPTDGEQSPLIATEVPPVVPVKPTPAVEFLMFMGDFIYADVPYYFGDTLQAYWRLYRRVYASKSFRRIYERLPVYNIYDDHEFKNNFGADGNDSTPPYPNASNAYDIYNGQANPDSKTGGDYYYDFRYGDTAFFVMDTRRYRSPPPPKSYPFPISLFTPLIEAVAEGRNPFEAYFGEPRTAESAGEPVPESARTMLGEAQLAALHTWIADVNRTATWKFVVSSVPLTAMWAGYDGHVDLWAGYMHERDTVLSLLGSVPNVVVLSGDRHEFAAVEFPRGKYVVREFSTSPLNQFYVPYARTLDPKHARTLSITRKNVTVTETGEELVEEYTEEVPEEHLLKYVPHGNHKWTTIEVDSTNTQAPTLKVELYINGKIEWEHTVAGDPVELTFPSSLVIASQVQGVVGTLKHALRGWFRAH